MSTALVEMFNNQPMTTSLAIADGIEMEHASVIKLVRKYASDLADFHSRVGFEIQPFNTDGGVQYREIAWLNEGQAMFLLTLQRNTAKVVQFKKALVQAFLEMRDRLASAPHRNEPLTLSHRADIMVSADRTFRSIMRSGRAAGLRTAAALRRANAITMENTGINMLAELQVEELAKDPAPKPMAPRLHFLHAWVDCELEYPCMPCRSVDLYRAYRAWCIGQNVQPDELSIFIHDVQRVPALSKKRLRLAQGQVTVIMPVGIWDDIDGNVDHFAKVVQ